jgi:hypothetical protein
MSGFRSLEGTQLVLEEDTIKCIRCETDTPESEIIPLGAWMLCGTCYDDI